MRSFHIGVPEYPNFEEERRTLVEILSTNNTLLDIRFHQYNTDEEDNFSCIAKRNLYIKENQRIKTMKAVLQQE